MNWLFRIFVLIGLMVVIALFSALLAPYFVNWERFTADFETQASRIVGQPVKVGGKTNLRLLPLPFVSFENLDVGENSDGSPLMTVERFSLNMELFPFLSGEVRIVEMAMLRPKVNLKVEENGTIAWTSPKEVLVDPELINIEKLTIKDGSVLVDGLAGNRQLEFENIHGDLSARSILGPWRINASTDVEGIASELKISTGTYQQNAQSIRLKIEASRLDQPYKLLMDGPVKLENQVLNWAGQFALTPFFENRLAQMDRPVQPLPVFTDGAFFVSPKSVQVPEYRMEIGSREDPYTITGSGVVEIQNKVFFRFLADGRQIDLDRFDEELNRDKVPTFENRVAVLRSILERIPVPTGTGEINAILPAIVAGDTFIRDVKTTVRPLGRGWDLRSFSAIFPGNTLVEANGRLGLHENFGFAGKMLIASRQPSGLASWMSGGVDAQIRRLKVLGLASDVTLTTRQAVLDNLELRMDDAVLRGKLQRLAPSNVRAALIAELQGNRVNIQDLRALYSLTRSSGETELATHDLDIKINADLLEAKLADKPVIARAVDGHVRIRDGNVSIERLNSGNFYGSSIKSSGRLENVLKNPDGNFKLDVKAENARELLTFTTKFVGQHYMLDALLADPALTEDTLLNFELDTRSANEETKGQLLIGGETGGTKLDMRIALDGRLVDPQEALISLTGNFTNPSTSRLVRQFAIDTLPDELMGDVPGPLKFNLDMKGRLAESFATSLSLSAPATNVSAGGDVKFVTSQEVDADLDVTIGSGNLAPYILLSGASLPGLSLETELPVSLKFQFSKASPSSKFENVSGQIGGNVVSGALRYQYAQVQRPRLSGELKLLRASVPLLADSVFGFYGLYDSSTLLSEQDREFQPAAFAGYDAKIALTADDIDTGFGFAGSGASAELVVLDGAVDLNDLVFSALEGKFTGAARLQNVDGRTVLGTLQLSLEDADITKLQRLTGLPQFVQGRISLNGSAETSGRSQTAMISNLAGNGVITISDAQIEGIEPNSFTNILLETDVEGLEINPERIAKLIDETVLTSGFVLDHIETPFSITRGSLKVRNLTHDTPQADFTSSIEVDIADAGFQGSTSITFKPGRRDVISGADPVVTIGWNGPFDAPQQVIDSGQLEGYLSLRAFENSQRRIETLEAQVIEKQRLQRQIAFNFAREQHQIRLAEEALRILEEQKRALEESERKRLEEAVRRLQEERARLAEEARIREEEARRLEEQRQAEEQARLEAEKARLAEEARRLAEEQRQLEELRKAEEEARLEAERLAAAQRAAEEAQKLEALRQAEAQRLAEEAAARQATAVKQQSSSGIQSAPLEPAKPAEETIAPSLRENIIQNIENFLNTN